MSGGYAERLSEYPNKGVCGLPEIHDPARVFASKLDHLSQLLRRSNYTVALTGAGISTSAGIPDFRGPSGIWTREQQERERKRRKKNGRKRGISQLSRTSDNAPGPKQNPCQLVDTQPKPKFASFETALPTYTHRALTHLILHPPITTEPISAQNGEEKSHKMKFQSRIYLHHIVTQNVDGLHRKSHLPRKKMSILHGDIFTEVCDTCNTEHVRVNEIQSIGLKHTGRSCTLGGTPVGSCPGKLKDTLLDWEDDLPEIDWARAQKKCHRAELVLCLGTSLRIEPAGGLCTYATEAGIDHDIDMGQKKKKKQGRKKLGYVIVNLQKTPYDEGAALVIRGKVDDVMKGVMRRLGYEDWDELAHDCKRN